MHNLRVTHNKYIIPILSYIVGHGRIGRVRIVIIKYFMIFFFFSYNRIRNIIISLIKFFVKFIIHVRRNILLKYLIILNKLVETFRDDMTE